MGFRTNIKKYNRFNGFNERRSKDCGGKVNPSFILPFNKGEERGGVLL